MREPKTLVEKVWERHVVHRVEGNERPTFAAPVAATPAVDMARRITKHKSPPRHPRRVSVVTGVNEPLAANRGSLYGEY
jgi:hypothetical protein